MVNTIKKEAAILVGCTNILYPVPSSSWVIILFSDIIGCRRIRTKNLWVRVLCSSGARPWVRLLLSASSRETRVRIRLTIILYSITMFYYCSGTYFTAIIVLLCFTIIRELILQFILYNVHCTCFADTYWKPVKYLWVCSKVYTCTFYVVHYVLYSIYIVHRTFVLLRDDLVRCDVLKSCCNWR